MKKALFVFLALFIAHFSYADQPDLYNDSLIETVKSHLPGTAKFYIDDVKSSDNNFFVSVVEYYENKPPHPHLFVMDSNFEVLKDIVIEDFSYFRGIMLEDIDQDMIEDVVVMTGTGANSNRIDIFLNKLRDKNDLINIFTETGNYTLRFYVALNVPTVEIASWTGTLDHPLTVFKWNGKEFVPEVNLVKKDDGNIYIAGQDGIEIALAKQGDSYNPILSADGKQVIFIKHVKPFPYTSDTGWFPSDHDEIWSMDIDGSNQRCIIKNNYSKGMDLKDYLGSFDSLYASPINGKNKIYFLCQNCATDAILYSANLDGTDVQRITNAHQLDLIGGDTQDEYFGYLVIGQRQSTPEKILWKSVLLDPSGNIIFEIDDIDGFWENHKKL